nr:hypothetical protein [Tanacetum cinerariifolium]
MNWQEHPDYGCLLALAIVHSIRNSFGNSRSPVGSLTRVGRSRKLNPLPFIHKIFPVDHVFFKNGYQMSFPVEPVIDELAEPIAEEEEQMVTQVMDMEEDLAMLFRVEDDSSDDDSEGLEDDEEVECLSNPAAEGHSLALLAPRVYVPSSFEAHVEQGQQAATQRDETIAGLSQHVQTLQAAVQHRDVQIQQLHTMVAEICSRESTLMQCILGIDRRLADLERRPSGPQESHVSRCDRVVSKGKYQRYFSEQIEPSEYSVNQPLNIQNELNNHELFINELIQQKLQKENENAQIFSAIPITLDLPTVEPEDSLRMRGGHLDTILKMELDEFIKSSVENLVPSPSKSNDLSDSECDVPACDDFTTFSNLLFDADDDFSSSDNVLFSNENISKEIYSNPLFDEEIISIDPHHLNVESNIIESLLNQDSSIISSSKIDSLLDEFSGELILLKSILSRIDEADCDPEEEIFLIEKFLYDNSSPRPPKEFISKNSDVVIESFSPSPIPVEDSDSLRDEIDLSLTPDDSMPLGIEDDDYDSEGDMLILEELLSNYSLSLPENESFHFDIPSSPRPPAKPPDDDEIKPNLRILTVKVVGDISKHYVPIPILLPT